MKVLTKKTIKKMKKKYDKKLDKKYKKYKKEQKEKAKQEKNLVKMNKRVEEFGYAIDESKILKKLKKDHNAAPSYMLLSDILIHHTNDTSVTTYHPYCKDGKVLLNVLEPSNDEKINLSEVRFGITFIINKNLELHEKFINLLRRPTNDELPNDSDTPKYSFTFITDIPKNIKVREPYRAYSTFINFEELVLFMNDILEGKIPNYLQFTKYSSHSIRVLKVLKDVEWKTNKMELIGYVLNDFPEIS